MATWLKKSPGLCALLPKETRRKESDWKNQKLNRVGEDLRKKGGTQKNQPGLA